MRLSTSPDAAASSVRREWVERAFEMIPNWRLHRRDRPPPVLLNPRSVVFRQFKPDEAAVQLFCGDQSGAASSEGIEDNVSLFEHALIMRPRINSGIWHPCQPVRSLNVPQTRGTCQVSSSELKLSGTSCGRKSMCRPEAGRGNQRQVAIYELPCRRHADLFSVERAVLWVFHKMEQMRVTAGEFGFAVHTKRVVPNDPASAD